ncbi:MAG: hypothetical protein WBB18_10140, partial [Nodosilinea sp.]
VLVSSQIAVAFNHDLTRFCKGVVVSKALVGGFSDLNLARRPWAFIRLTDIDGVTAGVVVTARWVCCLSSVKTRAIALSVA